MTHSRLLASFPRGLTALLVALASSALTTSTLAASQPPDAGETAPAEASRAEGESASGEAGEATGTEAEEDASGSEATAAEPAAPTGTASQESESGSEDDSEEARALLEHIDDLFRGESSIATMRMEIRTERWERTLRMRAWSEGTKNSLVRILSPPRERGTSTLRVEGDLWNYLPNVDRTVRVPAGMMSASWMGSHFTNDDLVQETRFSEDYDFRIASRPDDEPKGTWVIEMTPKPRAPVVWGKVVTKIRDEDRLPVETRFFDERDRLMRTMTYHDVREIEDRRIPARIRLTPEDKPDEYTELVYEEISFNVDIPPGTFTIQALRR